MKLHTDRMYYISELHPANFIISTQFIWIDMPTEHGSHVCGSLAHMNAYISMIESPARILHELFTMPIFELFQILYKFYNSQNRWGNHICVYVVSLHFHNLSIAHCITIIYSCMQRRTVWVVEVVDIWPESCCFRLNSFVLDFWTTGLCYKRWIQKGYNRKCRVINLISTPTAFDSYLVLLIVCALRPTPAPPHMETGYLPTSHCMCLDIFCTLQHMATDMRYIL